MPNLSDSVQRRVLGYTRAMSYAQPLGYLGLGDAVPVAASELGKIRSKDGWEYQITPTDVLWAARAADGEGGDAADTLWTWTQRYALPNFRRRYPTLTALIQAHSQPVNPIWRRDGSRCRPGGRDHGTDRCSEARLRRRDEHATKPFSAIDPRVQEKVLKWAKGQLPNPVPKSIDFANPPVTQSYLNRNPTARLIKQAGNWFVSDFGSENWPADQVTIHAGGRVAGPSAGGVLRAAAPFIGAGAIGLAAIFAGWAYWKYGRG